MLNSVPKVPNSICANCEIEGNTQDARILLSVPAGASQTHLLSGSRGQLQEAFLIAAAAAADDAGQD